MTVGSVMIVLFNVLPVIFALGDVGNKIKDIIEALTHFRNIFDIIEYENEINYLDVP